ncbi:hypothetical protein WN944_004611 [Citrus x changshan-huyou]|uniref:DUF4220 domain-containing protein n=1 Tax=Citrus x changshan-huyou TaxID=2935761 RepID=A0AAP0M498_9ROSI
MEFKSLIAGLPREGTNSDFIFEQIKENSEYLNQIYPIDDVHPREDQIYQPHAADQLNQTFHYLANWLPRSVVDGWELHDWINEGFCFNDGYLEKTMAKAAAKREINSSRGDWVLRKWERDHSSDGAAVKKIKESTKEPDLPRMIFANYVIRWHAATLVLYSTDDRERDPKRQFSKLLSDYLMYLLVVKPEMLNQVPEHLECYTWDLVKHFEGNKPSLEPIEVKNACLGILNAESEINDVMFKRGRQMAIELLNLRGDKWSLLAQVWVEMLAYAATHCRPRTHAQQLCNGGELLTVVWLLMLHFDLVDTKPED